MGDEANATRRPTPPPLPSVQAAIPSATSPRPRRPLALSLAPTPPPLPRHHPLPCMQAPARSPSVPLPATTPPPIAAPRLRCRPSPYRRPWPNAPQPHRRLHRHRPSLPLDSDAAQRPVGGPGPVPLSPIDTAHRCPPPRAAPLPNACPGLTPLGPVTGSDATTHRCPLPHRWPRPAPLCPDTTARRRASTPAQPLASPPSPLLPVAATSQKIFNFIIYIYIYVLFIY